MSEYPAAKLNYNCEAKTDREGSYYHPREFRCAVADSDAGISKPSLGEGGEIILAGGVGKQDACQRVFTTGNLKAVQLKK